MAAVILYLFLQRLTPETTVVEDTPGWMIRSTSSTPEGPGRLEPIRSIVQSCPNHRSAL